ncbi:MAG TPA: adenylyl-sulfate kinase [Pseudonocardiaceae bacterium]|jgi:adenylylsulfate kinase
MREFHEQAGVDFLEVSVGTPLVVCRTRDVKGLYARQARGEMAGLTGVDAPYEVPEAPDLCVDTVAESIDTCAERVVDLAVEQPRGHRP